MKTVSRIVPKITPKDPTAGYTSELAVAAIGNRYDLVLVGARRMRELGRGDMPKVDARGHGACVTALMEIEAGHVTRDYLFNDQDVAPRRRSRPHPDIS
jgi:DNA-directed RNA polymerase subunit omega